MSWKKLSKEEINNRVFSALDQNKNYEKENVLGIPASFLDDKVFSKDSDILKDAPFLTSLVRNPNHIGCHTLGQSESFFAGTQEIERELIDICAMDILRSAEKCDGYVASGGTEANMQAMWIYRNYFVQEYGAKNNEIAILCSEHAHYSMAKSANILNIQYQSVALDDNKFTWTEENVQVALKEAKNNGAKYFIIVANMMTTMFGSVDDAKLMVSVIKANNLPFKLHIDGAYGGFYYPFSNPNNELDFSNEDVSSVTLDAHKMAQAPYGTGIFLIRKGLMQYANTKEASYVKGEDSTVIGSRSGANAISIWMILSTYGPYAWKEKIFILQKRTEWLCDQLDQRNIAYFREPYSNIVTINAHDIDEEKAHKFGLVPDNHSKPNWFKIVVMEHVNIEKLEAFLCEVDMSQPVSCF
ncbi:MAG: pyridoxal phosphate-dependent decarboxylase family protein [Crocinitomicaceae bacterium]